MNFIENMRKNRITVIGLFTALVFPIFLIKIFSFKTILFGILDFIVLMSVMSIIFMVQKYLNYIKTVKRNGIAIFWRFLLRIYKIYGISLDLQTCVICERFFGEISVYYPLN